MGRQLTDEQLDELFENYRYTARRLETRDRYNTGLSTEPLRHYLAGELTECSFSGPLERQSTWMDCGGQTHG